MHYDIIGFNFSIIILVEIAPITKETLSILCMQIYANQYSYYEQFCALSYVHVVQPQMKACF